MSNNLPYRELIEIRRRDELAARKAADEAKRDPELEQATIAYIAHRQEGGQDGWEMFRRRWFMERGATDGR